MEGVALAWVALRRVARAGRRAVRWARVRREREQGDGGQLLDEVAVEVVDRGGGAPGPGPGSGKGKGKG